MKKQDLNFSTPEELLDWMNNIEYGWLDKDFNKNYDFDNWWEEYRLSLPEEVLKYKIGTCYEQTFFAAKMFNKFFNLKYKIIFIQQYKVSTHLCLIFKKNNKWYHFEHSFEKYKGIHGPYNTIKATAESVVKKMLEHEPSNYGYEWKIVDENKFNKRLTALEFYTLVDYKWENQDKVFN